MTTITKPDGARVAVVESPDWTAIAERYEQEAQQAQGRTRREKLQKLAEACRQLASGAH